MSQIHNFDERLAALDLNEVIERACQRDGLPAEMASRAEEVYRKFLTLLQKYPTERLVPPKIADYLWHQHMMDTEKYQNDCNNLFGEMKHHKPEEDDVKIEAGWQRTKTLFLKEFDIDLDTYITGDSSIQGAGRCA